MSPLGDLFRERLRKFPSIVNCCTIDWFSEWPDQALSSVASNTFIESGLTLDSHQDKVSGHASDKHQHGLIVLVGLCVKVVEMVKDMQQSVAAVSQDFKVIFDTSHTHRSPIIHLLPFHFGNNTSPTTR